MNPLILRDTNRPIRFQDAVIVFKADIPEAPLQGEAGGPLFDDPSNINWME